MVKPIPSNPSKSMARASRMIRGKRSGVVVDSSKVPTDETTGMEDVDALFDAMTSPVQEEEKKDSASVEKESRRRKLKTPKPVRMSLPGQEEEKESATSSIRNSTRHSQVKKYLGRIRSNNNTNLSPSELSRVSTAPPTPGTEGLREEEVEIALAQTGERESTEHPTLVQSPEADFPTELGDDFDDGDDLAPPAPPDDDLDDEVPEAENDLEALEETETEAGTDQEGGENPLSDTESDKEGEGFNMVHDPETPETVREERALKEKERMKKTKKKGRGRKSSDNSEGGGVTPTRKGRKKKKKRNVAFSPTGIPTANRDYEMIPTSDLVEESPEDKSLRRSRRARVKPLAFWKNEKFGFGDHNETGELGEAMGNMPVVKNVVRALPTPYRKRKGTNNAKRDSKASKSGRSSSSEETVAMELEPFDGNKLRRKNPSYQYLDGESAHIWDDGADESADLKVVSYSAKMEASDLPMSNERKKSEGTVVGEAAQAFNIPNDNNSNYVGYIMGSLRLPPKGIKDAESVGPCSQTFTVCHSQPKALEIAYGDPDLPDGRLDPGSAQRFLLSPGDLFRVPPGNCYRLQNHSDAVECLLTWTIIRPQNLP